MTVQWVMVRCAQCGTRGEWVGAAVVSRELGDAPVFCVGPRMMTLVPGRVLEGAARAHGPWLPL